MATLPRFFGARGETLRSATSELRLIWYWSAVAISAVFLVATFIDHLQSSTGFVLQKLLLTRENNPAALWSGLLLALGAVHAYDGFAFWRRRRVEVARGWASVALLLLILSADEIGSIHERVSALGAWLGVGHWLPLMPFALVLAAVLGYALVMLRRAEEQRGVVVVLLLGFFLLGSVALQEFIEHRIMLVSAEARAIRATLEEGTELVGILLLLKVAMANTTFWPRRGVEGWPCLEALRELRLPVTIVAFLLAPILAVGTAMIPHPHLGRPADWLAVVLLLWAALAACRPYLRGEAGRWPAWVLAGTCGVASVVIMEMGPDRLLRLGSLAASMRLLALAVLAAIAITMWGLLHRRHSKWLYLLGAAVMTQLGILSLLPVGATVIYGVTQLLAVAAYVAQVTMEDRVTAGHGGRAMSSMGLSRDRSRFG